MGRAADRPRMAQRSSPRSSGRTRSGSSGSPPPGTRPATAAPRSSRCIRWSSAPCRGSSGAIRCSAAMLVSNLAFFGSLVVLYDLTRPRVLRGVARRDDRLPRDLPDGVLLPRSVQRIALPPALAHRVPRGEAGSVGDRGGLAGALAALTRSIGVVLAPALIVMALERRSERGQRCGHGCVAGRGGASSARSSTWVGGSWRTATGWRRSMRRRTGNATRASPAHDPLERRSSSRPAWRRRSELLADRLSWWSAS